MTIFKKGNLKPLSVPEPAKDKSQREPAALYIKSVPNPLTKNIKTSPNPKHTPASKK